MTQETEKERIYRKTLENTRDRLDDFEEQYANKEVYSAFDELTGIVEKGLSQASKIPVTTNKLSVEKLQEQLNTAKKALTNIKLRTERDELETYYVERNHDIRKDAIDALAAIGGDNEC